LIVGSFILWTATAGSEWNSTHSRLGRPAPRVSANQTTYNKVVGWLFGNIFIACGIGCLVAALSRL
jgi:hypothetical protein